MASNQKSENRQPQLFFNFGRRGAKNLIGGHFDILYILVKNLKIENSIDGQLWPKQKYDHKLAKNMKIMNLIVGNSGFWRFWRYSSSKRPPYAGYSYLALL